MKVTVCRLAFTIPLLLIAACAASARAGSWAEDLAPQLTCGLSVKQIEKLAGTELVSLGARGRFGSHFLRRGATDVWLEFNDAGLTSLLIAKPRALKRMRVSHRTYLCTGEQRQLGRLYFPQALGGAFVTLDGLGIGQLPQQGRPFDFEMALGSHELLVAAPGRSPVKIRLSSEQADEDGIVVVRVELPVDTSPR